jgi:steroid 5-alpha reductase family enzyme
MSEPAALLGLWIAAALAMLAGWYWQRRVQNSGIVDVLWTASVAAGAVLLAGVGHGALPPRLLLALMGGAWGTRLAIHLARRLRREHEDGRYRQLRQRWGNHQGKLFLMFQGQAVLAVLFALPFLGAATNPSIRPGWLSAAIVIWTLTVAGEARADFELARFRADPAHRGRTCRQGLWRYSRHPNYLFEWLHWFSYVALAVGGPLLPLAYLGPLLMYVFLRWLSGIPFTEAQALRTRADYADYLRSTPMLFPRLRGRHEHQP